MVVDQKLLFEARTLLYHAKPRLFMESFLQVKTEKGAFVPMRFTANQEAYYAETFAKMPDLKRNDKGQHVGGFASPLLVYVDKPRKAESSTFWLGVATAYGSQVPVFDARITAQQLDTAGLLLETVDTFVGNLTEDVCVKLAHDDTSRKVFTFTEHVSGDGCAQGNHRNCKKGRVLSSSITISSARTKTTARGGTIKMWLRSETGLWEETYTAETNTAARNSMNLETGWDIEETTRPENLRYESGNERHCYQHYKAARDRTSPIILISRTWVQDPDNSLPKDSAAALDQDRDEVEKTGTLLLKKEEEDLGLTVEQTLWRRRKIKDNEDDFHGDIEKALANFKREYPERPNEPWPVGIKGGLSQKIRVWMGERVEKPKRTATVVHGYQIEYFEEPQIGGSYAVILDPAEDFTESDPTAIGVYNRDTGKQAADFYGVIAVSEAVPLAVSLCKEYFDASYCPLRTGTMYETVRIAKRLGYRNIWIAKSELEKDDPLTWKYGLGESGASRQADLDSRFVEQVERKDLWTPSAAAQQDWFGYDAKMARHKPDRVACAMGFAFIRYTLPRGREALVSGGEMPGGFGGNWRPSAIPVGAGGFASHVPGTGRGY